MSNIALAAWYQYLFTDDAEYLAKTGYPVIKECARFFLANMVNEAPDGGMFIGKCTDLERLGPAKVNPFMTSCGAIYTLEAGAKAAALLQADGAEAAAWTLAAARLRDSLPAEGDRYVPYAGCKDESVASLGGLFPYPVFDETSARQSNAVYHYVKNGRAFGNMYQMGSSVCAWYLGWMAAALAELGDKTEPAKMLEEAASGAGCFGELFEINEEKVSRCPWFSTASGNVVYALNQMLLQNREDGSIRLAQGVPEAWKDYAFKLACHGNLTAEVEVKGGKIVRLTLEPGDAGRERTRVIVLPAGLVNEAAFNRTVVKGVAAHGANTMIEVRIQGRTELVRRN
jgi:alpha-L-fucosidase 2